MVYYPIVFTVKGDQREEKINWSILATWIEGPVQNLKRIFQKTLQLPFFFPVQLILHTSMRIIRLRSIIEIFIIIKFVKKKVRKQV